MPTLRYARCEATDGTAGETTSAIPLSNPKTVAKWLVIAIRPGYQAAKNVSQVAGYQGERLLTQLASTRAPFVLSALRSKVYRSMRGVATAVFRVK